ncbi:MAG: nucleotidyltransferase [Cytophagaceae bacterium]
MEEKLSEKSKAFYVEAIQLLQKADLSFMIGGALALGEHANVFRDTKDLDIFCKPEDYPRIIKECINHGFKVEVTDARWLAKVFKEDYFIDIVFGSANNQFRITQSWFERSIDSKLFGQSVKLLSAEDLIGSKLYVQARERFDAADINHVILKKGKNLDWKLIINNLDINWPLLFSQIINFIYVYPGERDNIPKWLIEELISRLNNLFEVPVSKMKVCNGPLLDHFLYEVDIREWGYKIATIGNL